MRRSDLTVVEEVVRRPRLNAKGLPKRLMGPYVLLLNLFFLISAAPPQSAAQVTNTFLFITLAGNAGHGIADGAGAQVRFDQPSGIAVDRTTNVYVADTFNHAIRKMTPDGVVT